MFAAPLWEIGLTFALLAVGADGPDLKKGVTDPAQADADFQIQGEYVGNVCHLGYQQPIGLQVVAYGDGKFEGLVYPGGLPGNGYNGSAKTPVKGERTGDAVVLVGGDASYVLQAGRQVAVTAPSGATIGFLQPMQRYSTRTGALPPAGAVILFNGSDTSKLKNAKVSANGLLQIGTETVDTYRDFYLHAEFKIPYMPYAKGQARGNSGFYLQKRYEVQVLDSFGLESQFNDAASLYRTKAPDLNLCFPPLSWQTYDIDFTAARFDDAGKRISKTRISVWHNAVLVQNNFELDNKTGGGSQEGPQPLPILLQNHGNPVEFRNIWLVDKSKTPTPTTTSAACQPCVLRCR
jgi:hypothetical protein